MPRKDESTKKQRGRKDRGAAAVEFALVLPLLLTLLFGIIEFGWAYAQMLDVRHGAREGARLVAVNDFPAGLTADDLSAAQQTDHLVATICDRMDLTNDAKISLELQTVGGVSAGQTVDVTVEMPLQTVTGWFDPLIGSKELTSTLQVRIEQEATWQETTDQTCASTVAP